MPESEFVLLAGFSDSVSRPFLVIHRRSKSVSSKDPDVTNKADRVDYPIIEVDDPTKHADCVFDRKQIKKLVDAVKANEHDNPAVYKFIREHLLLHQSITVGKFKRDFVK